MLLRGSPVGCGVGCQDYEQPLLQLKPLLLSRSAIKVIFYKVKEILHCHSLFNIELAEHVRAWDEEEKLGTVFTASVRTHSVHAQYTQSLHSPRMPHSTHVLLGCAALYVSVE